MSALANPLFPDLYCFLASKYNARYKCLASGCSVHCASIESTINVYERTAVKHSRVFVTKCIGRKTEWLRNARTSTQRRRTAVAISSRPSPFCGGHCCSRKTCFGKRAWKTTRTAKNLDVRNQCYHRVVCTHARKERKSVHSREFIENLTGGKKKKNAPVREKIAHARARAWSLVSEINERKYDSLKTESKRITRSVCGSRTCRVNYSFGMYIVRSRSYVSVLRRRKERKEEEEEEGKK